MPATKRSAKKPPKKQTLLTDAAPPAKPRRRSALPRPRAPSTAPAAPTLAVAESWRRIEGWFARQPHELDLQLGPPASAASIAGAEAHIGSRFPDDFRASLLLHDGQEDTCQVWWLPWALRLGTLASIVWRVKADRAAYAPHAVDALDRSQRVKQSHFHPLHVPIAGAPHWDYDLLLLDLAPGPKGAYGQVIARNESDFVFVAPSFAQLLTDVAVGLESGAHKVWRND